MVNPLLAGRVRLAALVAVGALAAGCGGSAAATPTGVTHPATTSTAATPSREPLPTRHGKLPKSTTFATIKAAPHDGGGRMQGTVVHPRNRHAVSAKPGDTPFAVLPTRELGSPTWVPVTATQPGWMRVLLPSRPDGSIGWIRTNDLDVATTPYVVHVDTEARRLTLARKGHRLGAWSIAVGKHTTPTPHGRTFVMASVVDSEQRYTPVLLPLGTHSATLDTFGGGPGTVAIHGWPDTAVFGHAVSHGCIRVPADALRLLRRVPLGTPVLIR